MCWMCRVREQSIYGKCDGCDKAFDKSNLQEYDIHKEWGQIAEFIEHKQRVMVFCANCRDAMDTHRESVRQQAAETEPSGWTLPENGVPVLRCIDKSHGTIPVGVYSLDKTLGIRCAQIIYGHDATSEILQGFVYSDDEGHQIKRLTIEDVDETVRCDKCWLKLYECNAREVSR